MAIAATNPVTWLTSSPITDDAAPMLVEVALTGKIDLITWAAQSSPGSSALQLMFMPELTVVSAMAGIASSTRGKLSVRGQKRRIASSRE